MSGKQKRGDEGADDLAKVKSLHSKSLLSIPSGSPVADVIDGNVTPFFLLPDQASAHRDNEQDALDVVRCEAFHD